MGRFLNDADSEIILISELNISPKWECQGWNEESGVTRAVCRSRWIPKRLRFWLGSSAGEPPLARAWSEFDAHATRRWGVKKILWRVVGPSWLGIDGSTSISSRTPWVSFVPISQCILALETTCQKDARRRIYFLIRGGNNFITQY